MGNFELVLGVQWGSRVTFRPRLSRATVCILVFSQLLGMPYWLEPCSPCITNLGLYLVVSLDNRMDMNEFECFLFVVSLRSIYSNVVKFIYRTSPAEFIVPYDQYMESLKNNYTIGMRFKMRFEGEEAPEQRYEWVAFFFSWLNCSCPISCAVLLLNI